MKRVLLMVAAAAMVAMSLQAGSADEIGQTKSYVGPVGDVTVLCPDPISDPIALTLPGIGGNCFDVSGYGRYISVSVEDSIVERVGFNVGFYGEDGRIGDLARGCGDAFYVMPEGTTMIRVFVGVLNGPAACDSGLPNDVGLLGQITVMPQLG